MASAGASPRSALAALWWLAYLLVGALALALLLPLALLALPLCLLVALWCLPVQLLRRRPVRARSVRLSLLALLWLAFEWVSLPALLLARLASLPPRLLRRNAPWYGAFHAWWLRVSLTGVLRLARVLLGFVVSLEEPGSRPGAIALLEGRAPMLVLARHAGPGASLALLHTLLSRYGRTPRVVLKAALRFDPFANLTLSALGATWVRGPGAAPIGRAAHSLGPSEALVLFPEGADWTPVRRLKAIASLQQKGRLHAARAALSMPHVLPPRPLGTLAALGARPELPVAVFTHTGHDELLSPLAAWRALPLTRPLCLTWWLLPPKLPRDSEDELLSWLTPLWADLDAWISERLDLLDLTESSTSPSPAS